MRCLPSACEICGGKLSKIGGISENIVKSLKGYEFETFLVGSTLPQTMVDKEDEIRSSLKIRGKENLKTQVTRTIGRKVAKLSGRKIDYSRPDITILVSLLDGDVRILPRSIWMSGNYLKRQRGVSQRSKTCSVCSGLGCATCGYKGTESPSVQSIVAEHLKSELQAEECNFIWIGSEDENSLVDGEGRPFFVEIQKPRRRHLKVKRLPRKAPQENVRMTLRETLSNGIEISSMETLPSKPSNVPQFKIGCEVHLIRKKENELGGVSPKVDVSEIESRFHDANVMVQLSRKFRRVRKHIDSIRVALNEDGERVTLLISCDGGTPIRKMIGSNDASVVPDLSQFIRGYEIDDSQPFDILNVELLDVGKMRTDMSFEDDASLETPGTISSSTEEEQIMQR